MSITKESSLQSQINYLKRRINCLCNSILGLESGGSGELGYKVYVALLSQSGTDAPVATVLENTLGGTVVWSYVDVGVYLGTLENAFPDAKTVCFMGNNMAPFHYFGKILEVPSDDDVVLQTVDGNGNPANELLYQTAIEIRVYP